MEIKWIRINERLKNGIQLINSLARNTFQFLLTHIIDSKNGEPFTEKELEELKTSLKLNDNSLELLILSISGIFKSACQVILKPTVLQKQLCEDIGLNTEIAEEFVKFWSAETHEHFGDFENGMKLENMAWELNVQCADQVCNKQNLPVARVQFNLAKLANETEKESLTVEMDKNELQEFYNTLEIIQIKLDNMQNIGNR